MRGRKHLALLLFMAVERRAQYRRDELVELLWSGLPPAEGRHSLATAASAIRRALGPSALEGSRELLRLRHEDLRLDLDRLEAGDLFETAELPAVDVDTFLSHFEIRDAPAFLHWRDRQHANWLPRIMSALVTLIDHARRTGASRVAGHLADRLLGIDGLSEAGVRAKMESLAFTGDRIAALRVYEEWRTRLHEELGAAPHKLLAEMARRLQRRGLERPVADPAPSIQTDPWRDRPFVGRAREHRALYAAWERAQDQSPGHFLVEGESGIGKSTLVERFAMAAALEGAVTSRVQCYELEQGIPFAAVAGLVVGLLDKPGVASTDPAALAEVARVVPKVRERFSGLPAPMDSQGETARLHFAEGVLAMLEAAMEEHPVILIVDDFHLSDEVSLTVLHLLLRRMSVARLMVLLTTRKTDLAPGSGAARIYGGGDYLRMTRLRLPPLTEAESAELLASLVAREPAPPDPPARHVLLQAARGVPMVLQLLVQDWQRQGTASLALSLRAMTAQPGHEAQEPEGAYKHLVARLLDHLDAPTGLVLHAATVFGSRVNDLPLYQVADLTTSQAMMGLAELTRRHILRDSPTGLDFANELVRGEAYTRMPGALRRALHAAVAVRLLARLESGEEVVRGLEAAWHLVRGGRVTEAGPHLLRGGREAIWEGAPHEAELAFDTALRDSEMLQGQQRHEAHVIHSEVLQELSMWKKSLTTLENLPSEVLPRIEQGAAVHRLIAERHIGYKGNAYDRERYDALVLLAMTAEEQRVRARAASTAAQIMEEMQVQVDVRVLSDQIDLLLSTTDLPDVMSDVLMARATLLYHERRVDEAVKVVTQGLDILSKAKISHSTFVNLHNALCALHCSQGEYRKGQEVGHEAYRLASRLDNRFLAMKASVNLCVSMGRQGDYRGQEEWARHALTFIGGDDHYIAFVRPAFYVAEAKAMRYQPDAIAAYHSILSQAPDTDNAWGPQASLLNEADIYQLLGQPRKAIQRARLGTSGNNVEVHNRGWTGKFARWIALTAVADGKEREALARIAGMLTAIEYHDAIDQVEIALSYLLLTNFRGKESKRLTTLVRDRLNRMPPAVSDRLQRQRILPEIHWKQIF